MDNEFGDAKAGNSHSAEEGRHRHERVSDARVNWLAYRGTGDRPLPFEWSCRDPTS